MILKLIWLVHILPAVSGMTAPMTDRRVSYDLREAWVLMKSLARLARWLSD